MINSDIITYLNEQFLGTVGSLEEGTTWDTPGEAYVPLAPERWLEIAQRLRDEDAFRLDSLQCITGVDVGPDQDLEVRYNLHSMEKRHTAEIRISVSREHPEIPSIAQVWKIGDWFEREVYDMYGIVFTGHPDLKRILLPDDWEGWPLRKDYEEPQTYHGIVVPKVKTGWE
jgi:NADH-quinone oxidoreductase subunit C